MAKKTKRKIARGNHDIYIEPVIFLSSEAPPDLENIVSDLVSMSGILRLTISYWNNVTLYNYIRWGKEEKTLEISDTIQMLNVIKKQLKKIGRKSLQHLIIRSDDINLVIFSTEKIILLLQCDKKAKLPLVTVKAKRVTQKLARYS